MINKPSPLTALININKPIIGMIHALPTAGSPKGYVCNIDELKWDGNELFKAMIDRDVNDLNNNNKILANFLNDTIENIIEEYKDKLWTIQTDLDKTIIPTKISLQKEKEKQRQINKLDGMSSDERLIYTNLQNYGLSDWYKESEEANMRDAEIKDDITDSIDDHTNVGDDNSENEGYGGTDVDGGGGDEGDGGDGGWDNENDL